MTKRRIAGLSLLVLCCAALIPVSEWIWDRLKTKYAESLPRPTAFPSSAQPDLVCLTWSADPSTSQTIQWRTSPAVEDGLVQYRTTNSEDGECVEKGAERSVVEDPLVINDPLNHRFTVFLENLLPNATYSYRAGSKEKDAWTDWAEFSTAPQGAAPFSFVYLGDVQIGFDAWEDLLRRAQARNPEAAFYVIAGDLVNRGNHRDEWDWFFHAARGIFDRYPVVPAIGNHECPNNTDPLLYLQHFALPENGPATIASERAYSFSYSNALFVVLDSNLPPQTQRAWLELQLKNTDATWKFAVYHHPAYSSKETRDNPEIRAAWCDLFDLYHVDVAFQGHDHAYLRTQPMRAGKTAQSAEEGTIYIISVSGTKYYEMLAPEYAVVSMANTSTYQIVEIETGDANRLTYRAYTFDGEIIDEFVIDKGPVQAE